MLHSCGRFECKQSCWLFHIMLELHCSQSGNLKIWWPSLTNTWQMWQFERMVELLASEQGKTVEPQNNKAIACSGKLSPRCPLRFLKNVTRMSGRTSGAGAIKHMPSTESTRLARVPSIHVAASCLHRRHIPQNTHGRQAAIAIGDAPTPARTVVDTELTCQGFCLCDLVAAVLLWAGIAGAQRWPVNPISSRIALVLCATRLVP